MDTGILEFAAYSRNDMILTKEMLLSFEPHLQYYTDVNWDGQNDKGLRMPSGTYIFVVENHGKRLVRRLNLVR